jgi:hypothetical protein
MVATIRVDVSAAVRKIDLIEREGRFAAWTAVKATVDDMRSGLKKEMVRVFDRPTRMTLDSLYGKYPSRTTYREPGRQIVGEVGIKDDVFVGMKGRWKLPAIKFLAPQIYGGARQLKGFEIMLQKRGIMPKHLYAVPGEAMQLDAYGNMNRGQLIQILSYFDTWKSEQTIGNSGTKGRKKLRKGTRAKMGKLYFAVWRSGQNFRPGIWESVRTAWGWSTPRCVIAFVRRPHYRQRFRFHEVGAEIRDREFPINWRWAKRDAMGYLNRPLPRAA